MLRNIRAVLFDLGNTLMYPHVPWPPIFQQGAEALGEYLRSHGVDVDPSSFPGEFRHHLSVYYAERERTMVERSSLGVLTNMLAEQGHADLPHELLRTALDQYYAVTQQNWLIEDDTIPTLEALRSQELQLGMVSNASDSRDVQTLVDKFGVREYFDFILISADCGYRKPHARIFELALANWPYQPDEIVMVGDRLNADVGGARPLGIHTIWIKRRAKDIDLPPDPHPDATVQTLGEIPPLLLEQFK